MNLQLDVCITFPKYAFYWWPFWNYPYIKGMSKRPDTLKFDPTSNIFGQFRCSSLEFGNSLCCPQWLQLVVCWAFSFLTLQTQISELLRWNFSNIQKKSDITGKLLYRKTERNINISTSFWITFYIFLKVKCATSWNRCWGGSCDIIFAKSFLHNFADVEGVLANVIKRAVTDMIIASRGGHDKLIKRTGTSNPTQFQPSPC